MFTGQGGPGGADVVPVLSADGWSLDVHHHQREKPQGHGHHWVLGLVHYSRL